MTAPEFSWGVRTDVGRVRQINEDSVHAQDGLYVVADGMGGHSGGEVASAVAIETVSAGGPPADIDELIEAVRSAPGAILERAVAEPELYGMGTTLCAIARLADDRLGLVNVGDSRIYLFADGELHQVSEDHSLVGELYRAGHLSEDEAAVHPQRNIVTRALGIGDELLVDYWELPARAGDVFLLCSDGLVDEVSDNQIAAAMRRLDDPNEVVDELVRLANDSGSRDNVSVLIVRVDAGSDGETALALSPQVDAPERAQTHAGRGTAPLVDARRSEADEAPTPKPDRPRMPKRGLAAAVVTALILVGAFWLVASYARNNYFIAFENEQVVIYQGRPGGVLWFDPTLEEAAPLLRESLTDALASEVEGNPEFGSLGDAQDYVAELQERAAEVDAIDPSTGDG
ncbi:MAG: Stp1/IreP family PP2C-type Ser/Thr phosphatase [Actinomycetota bacterium]